MKNILSIVSIFLLSLTGISAQVMEYDYHDFYVSNNIDIVKLQDNITLEERNYILFLIDSFPNYDAYFREKLEAEPDSIRHAFNISMNIMLKAQFYIIIYESEKAIRVIHDAFKIMNEFRERFQHNKEDHFYKELEGIRVLSQLFLSIIHLFSGDIETASFYIEKTEEILMESELEKRIEINLKTNISQLGTAIAMGNRECFEAHEQTDMQLNYYSNPITRQFAEKDSLAFKDFISNSFNAYQYKVLAISCTCDSLATVGKYQESMAYMKENGKYFERFFDVYYEYRDLVGPESMNYTVTTFGSIYYAGIRDFEKLDELFMENKVDEQTGIMRYEWYRDRSQSYVRRDLDKAEEYVKIALDISSTSRELDGIVNPYKLEVLRLGLTLLEAKISEAFYKLRGDTDKLKISYEQFSQISDEMIEFRKIQNSELAAMYVESELKDVNDMCAKNAYYCYKEFGDEKYLYDCIRYTENSKSYLLRKSNRQVVDEQFRQDKNIQSVFSQERMIANKMKFFQSLLDKEEQKSVVVDSIMYYKKMEGDLVESIKSDYPDYYEWKRGNVNVDISSIQNQLSSDQAIFSYLEDPEMSLLHVITKGGIESFALDSIQFWIDDLIAFNVAIKEGGKKKAKKYGYKIYQSLLQKGLESLSSNINRIIFIPDGEINELNMGAVPLDEEMKILMIDKYAITYQYSLELLNLQQKRTTETELDFLAFIPEYMGTPKSDNKLRCTESPLVDSKKQLRLTEKLFNRSQLTESAALDDVISQSLSAKVMHFSAHGCVSENQSPFNYSLLMTLNDNEPSELKVIDIYGLDMKADLVVLGACDSGNGQLKDGIGVYSIARAFHYAGCPNTIATTAVVNEKSTAGIIHDFYQYLLDGHPIDVALQKSKLDFIRNKPDADPFEWSNIILIGNPTRIPIN